MSTTPSSQINITKPPIKMNMAEDQFSWRKWIDSVFTVLGPANNTRGSWTPKFTGLTTTGTPKYVGNYYRFGFFLAFEITIKEALTVASVAGTSYCNNLPIKALFGGNLIVNDATTKIFIGTGYIEPSTTNAYLPTWNTTTDSVSISGLYLIDV